MNHCKHPGHIAGKHHPWARYLLQQFPHLWAVIADFPDLIKYDGMPPGDDEYDDEEDVGDDSGYRDGITDLSMAHNFLCKDEL